LTFLALANGDADLSIKLAQALMKTVEETDPASLPNKNDVIANIHSCIGNAFVEMENLNKALKHHQKDLEMSRKRLVGSAKTAVPPRIPSNITRSPQLKKRK
jgi:hypothetical protein